MAGRTRIPFNVPAELRQVLEDIYLKLDRISGPLNTDFKGRRIINAGSAEADTDYVTLADLKNYVRKMTGKSSGNAAIIGTSGGGTGGGGGGTGGGGSGGCAGRTQPVVDFPDDSATVEAYAAANPTQLANSCLDTGGTWDFMDGVVAALQAVDNRYGFNAKRGNCSDPSEDAISYYFGDLGLMTACSQDCYVIDIIGGHCGPSPTTAWINQTSAACGGWLPTRP